MNTTQFQTFYGLYTEPFLKTKTGIIECVFYQIQNSNQYIGKYIYVGGVMTQGVLLVQEIVV
jgi:hypothetical protein